ncbi:MAG: GNAT family N-acetyltransferase, partial [Myxococcota bacterium]|nr:GNAT family N-acetyltransferase [Myxococcota bacterium]
MFVRVQEATSDADREEIYRFRYRVYVEELKKPLPFADQERRIFTDELDEHARLLVAYDENAGTIVGTVRTIFGAEHPFPEDLVDRLSMGPMIRALGQDQISHSGIFMVDPAHRGLTIASQLVAHMFQLGLTVGAAVDVCVAELALVRPYYQLGYRPYAAPQRPYANAGLRVPLVWTGRDRGYLASVGSPFAQFLSPDLEDGGAAADSLRPHYSEFRNPSVTPRKLKELWSAIAHSSPAFRPRSLFEGVEREVVDSLLDKMPTLTITTGEQFYRKGERERGMGLLLSGKLGVTLDETPDPFFFAVLVPGELFGEMANVLDGGRTANLVALEDSEILILPDNLLEKIGRKQPAVADVVR